MLAVGGCAQEYDNPFAERGRTVAPPDSAILLFTSARWTTSSGAGREVFAVNADGSEITRLTYCNTETSACDNLDIAPSPDRLKIVSRRLTSSDPAEAIVYVDLARGVETTIVPSSRRVSSLEWDPSGVSVLYSGLGQGGKDDLYSVDYNGQNDSNFTVSPDKSERHPRYDPTGTGIVFGSVDASGLGLIQYITSAAMATITAGGEPGAPLPGQPWIVGSDADPSYSPTATAIVFRRCTGVGRDGRGTWDILTISEVLGTPKIVAAGALYRSEPDWGPAGIAFYEVDPDAGVTRLVVVDPDGGNRRVLSSQSASIAMGPPRFLPAR
jgi:hypothetical protein